MTRRLLLASVALIGAGVALLLMSNPLLRSAFSGTSPRSFSGQLSSGQVGSGTFASAAGRSNATPVIESLVGFGFAAIGLILEVLSMFTNTAKRDGTAVLEGEAS